MQGIQASCGPVTRPSVPTSTRPPWITPGASLVWTSGTPKCRGVKELAAVFTQTRPRGSVCCSSLTTNLATLVRGCQVVLLLYYVDMQKCTLYTAFLIFNLWALSTQHRAGSGAPGTALLGGLQATVSSYYWSMNLFLSYKTI